eukprot:CAMPEP_0114689432 /NCGR_PEP_ID=MMETSP0191-20121206/64525_1 /TAXON_ID=126664 /ORGANISM="Sorites sp." /LENGTH=55 /DNA_ID=CAMNT_0001978015 /DNA_START=72 /DNA_END=239 /DNA_ORIENTATION=-
MAVSNFFSKAQAFSSSSTSVTLYENLPAANSSAAFSNKWANSCMANALGGAVLMY